MSYALKTLSGLCDLKENSSKALKDHINSSK